MAETSTVGLTAGVSAAWRGFRTATQTPDVGKTYTALAGAMFGTAALIDFFGIWAMVHFTATDGLSWWATLGLLLLRIAGILVVLLAAPVLALFTVNLILPFLGERVFFAGLRATNPTRAAELEAMKPISMWSGVAQNLIRLLLFLALSVAAFALSFVPVVGPLLAPTVQVLLTARALGWELLDPYFERLNFRFDEQHAFVKIHRRELVGFALPYSLIMAIPLVGPLVFGVAQAAIGTLVTDVLEANGPTPASYKVRT